MKTTTKRRRSRPAPADVPGTEAANGNATVQQGSHDPVPAFAVGAIAAYPRVELRPTGSGVVLARTLVRVLVRRALMQEGAIGVIDDCAHPMKKK